LSYFFLRYLLVPREDVLTPYASFNNRHILKNSLPAAFKSEEEKLPSRYVPTRYSYLNFKNRKRERASDESKPFPFAT
jgi:hypothetical protein